ncbi:MAG: hypothetical protein JWM93_1877, partial [Frankiales bacterium]|nr:hypothetical protein [Frankiales bacterium]
APLTRALWECETQPRHRFATWAAEPATLAAWTGEWWPQAGLRPDLEADRPPHWT